MVFKSYCTKQSQCVIAQIEHDYSVDILREKEDKYVYGVFSNEDNIFKYYGFSKRKKDTEYKKLRASYKAWQKDILNKTLENEFHKQMDSFCAGNNKVSFDEIMASLDAKSVVTLSWSIKALYYVCMVISIVTFIIAAFIVW